MRILVSNLRLLLSKVVPAIHEEDRSYRRLDFVQLRFSNNTIQAIATDGRRLHHATIVETETGIGIDRTWYLSGKDATAVANEKTTKPILATIDIEKGTIEYKVKKNRFFKMVEVERFPNLDPYIQPETDPIICRIQGSSFDLINLFQDPPEHVTISVNGQVTSTVERKITLKECKFEGEIPKVSINPRFMRDAMRASGCDDTEIRFTGTENPVYVASRDSHIRFGAVVMPCNLDK